jgi:hypothetical protein
MPKRPRRKASSTKKEVGVRLDPTAYKRLLKAASEFTQSIVNIASGGGPKKKGRPRKRRKPGRKPTAK